MKHLQILWAKWRLSCATEELAMFQARFDVQPNYLVNTMQHINHLTARIEALRGCLCTYWRT